MNDIAITNSRPKRPRTVTFLALSVLIIAVFFLARVYQAFMLGAFIESLSPGVSMVYLVLTGFVFGAAGLPIAWGLWTGKTWAGSAGRQYFVALSAYYWLDYLFFVVSDTVRGNWPFAIGTTIIVLALVFWILKRKPAKKFFLKSREDVPENGDRNVE